jgi:phage/plasmid-associated DNA primase
MAGLERLRYQGNFSESESCASALQGYRERADSVAAFVADCCEAGDWKTPKAPVYAAYRDYCAATELMPLGRTKFYERMEATPGVHEGRDDTAARERIWSGIRVRLHEVPAGRGWVG